MFVHEFALVRRSTLMLLAALAAPAALSGQSAREDSTDWAPAGIPAWRLGLAPSPAAVHSAGSLAWTCVAACVRPAAVAADGIVAPMPGLVVAAGAGAAAASNGQPFRGEGAVGAPSNDGVARPALTDATEDEEGAEETVAESDANGTAVGRSASNGRAVPVLAAAAVGVGAVIYATQHNGPAAAPRDIRTPEFLPLRQPTLELDPTFAGSEAGAAATVPEPAAISLLALGIAGLGVQRRRRR